jgi:hypothetical protein
MTDTARRLRAQKAYSTDPAYLERMAREEETRRADPTNDGAAEGGSAFARRSDNVISEMGAPVQVRASCVRYDTGQRQVSPMPLACLGKLLTQRQAEIAKLQLKVDAASQEVVS